MKACPQCGACYEDDAPACHRDGNRLDRAMPGGCLLAERFYIEQRLGSGGSGTVFRAIHVGTGRAVALKVLASHLAARPEWQARFRREAAAAGRLKHPHIVDITDFGTVEIRGETVAFLAMEYLQGRSLGWYLRRGPLPPADAGRWLAQAAAAVDFAHRAGILHRDLKPDNIWVEELPDGQQRVKVLDFGLAKVFDPGVAAAVGALATTPDGDDTAAERALPSVELLSASDLLDEDDGSSGGGPRSRHPTVLLETPAPDDPPRPTPSSPADALAHGPVTELGTVMGTPAYMSPEQAGGRPAIAASDVYALGVIAFEMLTGRLPFGGTTSELLHHHRETAAPDPGLFNRKISRSMRRAVLSALAKDPALRPPTPLELARQISGSLRVDELAGRALLTYATLVGMWALTGIAVSAGLTGDPLADAAARRALSTTNLAYFLALSLALMLFEYDRDRDAKRLWPLCLLAFPLLPVWLVLLRLDRRRRNRVHFRPDSAGSPGRTAPPEGADPGESDGSS